MKSIRVLRSTEFDSEIEVSPDKSISHRAAILAALATGRTVIENYLLAQDTLHTLKMLRSLGVKVNRRGTTVEIEGRGLYGLKPPEDVINLGNSGTAMRISSGFLSAQPFLTVLTGDASLRRRPMRRIITPLRQMGAKIFANEDRAPMAIFGGPLKGILYKMPVASAQVKTALMFAGLYADGVTEIEEPAASRDHTERLFTYLGIPYMKRGNNIRIMSIAEFASKPLHIPGDISSAAFFIAYTILHKNSILKIRGVNVNHTRVGFLEVLKQMGADVEIKGVREECGEPIADVVVGYKENYEGIQIGGEIIPRLIDEIPILSVVMALANTKSEISDAAELRVKESDRIKSTVALLRAFNVEVEEKDDGFIVYPSRDRLRLMQEEIDSQGDHRIAMSAIVFAAALNFEVVVRNVSCIDTSFPDFFNILQKLGVEFSVL